MRKLTLTGSKIGLVMTAATALAAFTDKANNFSIDFPTGWSDPVTDSSGNVQSSPSGKDLVLCRANSNVVESLKDASQASLNKQYAAPLDKDTWASVLSVDASKVTLVDHEARVVNGAVVQFATLAFTSDVMGVEAKARFASHILPGRMVNAGCFAGAASFADKKAEFEKIVTSLKPL